jgi:long-chain fatty acid transport protein
VFVDNPSPQPDELNLYLDPFQMEEDVAGWTYGATVGLLYQATQTITVGATVRSPMKVTLEGDVEVTSTSDEYQSPKQTESYEFTYPTWAGLGFAYRNFLFDGVTLTGDVQWTQWSAVEEIVRDVATPLPNGLGESTLNWEDTVDVAVGVDWRLSRSLSLVGGYARVASPSPDETFDFILPLSSRNTVSMGARMRRDVWRIDFSLAYGVGEPRQISGSATMDGKHIEDLMVPSLALTYGF